MTRRFFTAVCRRWPTLAIATLIFFGLPALCYSLADFLGIGLPRVFVRDQAVAVPFLLGFLAYGFGGVRHAACRRNRWYGRLVTTLGFALLVFGILAGPLRSGLPPMHPFGLMYSSMAPPHAMRQPMIRANVPAFYEGPHESTLIEWFPGVRFIQLAVQYQQVHRRPVIRCHFRQHSPPVPGFRFRTFVYGLSAIREDRLAGSYVVLHLNAAREMVHIKERQIPPASSGQYEDYGKRVSRAREYCLQEFGASCTKTSGSSSSAFRRA